MLKQYNKYKLLGLAIFSSSAVLMITLTFSAVVLLTAGCGKNSVLSSAEKTAAQATQPFHAE